MCPVDDWTWAGLSKLEDALRIGPCRFCDSASKCYWARGMFLPLERSSFVLSERGSLWKLVTDGAFSWRLLRGEVTQCSSVSDEGTSMCEILDALDQRGATSFFPLDAKLVVEV